MKTLRNTLETKDDQIFLEDVESMAKKLGIDVKLSGLEIHYIDKIKAQTIINQFQIQFGLDEEF